VVVSFTVETDGRLPSGTTLGEAVSAVDAATGGYPLQYGINCAHPDHIEEALVDDGDWVQRIGLLRANASRLSHGELDEATELDDGDPVELGAQYADLRRRLPHLVVLGGCCGTDDRHVGAIASACTAR
jgi:homocysteine S-methyltransferase